jgi:ABC-2 type transport system permease protein
MPDGAASSRRADQPLIAHAIGDPETHMRVRRFGAVNWLGLKTLYFKEVERFSKVFTQTLLAPLVTSLLFLLVFSVAFGGAGRGIEGVPFLVFLAPGLIMMAITQNAFANTTSSIMIAKVQGCIVDVLMPPLSAAELTLGYAGGGITRGILVGVTVGGAMAIVMAFFEPLPIHSPLAILYFAFGAATMMSLFGIIVAIWAEKFDFLAAVTNFVVMPLVFLSGTFYSVERLPSIFYVISHVNPFFYLIDGLRYGFIGRADGSVLAGVIVIAGINIALAVVCHQFFARGYKLKT